MHGQQNIKFNFYNNNVVGLVGATKKIPSPCHLTYRVGPSARSARLLTRQNL